MQRATRTAARLVTEGLQTGGFRYRAAFVTLTYRDDGTWRPRHISDLVKHYRQWLERRGHKFRCAWVAELTGRGRVHYHLCLWLPKGITPPMPDKQGWWPHGSTRVEWARNCISYMAKYASKDQPEWLDHEYQPRQFPKHCRIHARAGLELADRRAVSWWCLPQYVRTAFPEVGAVVRRAVGGGWVEPATGEWLAAWTPDPPS